MLGFCRPQGGKQGIAESNFVCPLIRFNFKLGTRRDALGGVPWVLCSILLLDWFRKFPFAGFLNLTLSERVTAGDKVDTLFGGGEECLDGGEPLKLEAGSPRILISHAGNPSLFGSGGIVTCNYTGVRNSGWLISITNLSETLSLMSKFRSTSKNNTIRKQQRRRSARTYTQCVEF